MPYTDNSNSKNDLRVILPVLTPDDKLTMIVFNGVWKGDYGFAVLLAKK